MSERATDANQFDVIALGSRYHKWDLEASSRFSSLRKQIEDWDRSRRNRAKLLRFLDDLKKRGVEAPLIGLLSESLEKDGSYLRQAVSRERQCRLRLLSGAVSGLAKAAAGLLNLVKLDESSMWRVMSTSGKQERKVLTDQRRRLADQLMMEAALLKQECKSVKKFLSTQRLGAFRKHGNIECLLQIRSWLAPKLGLALSFNDLALLIDAASMTWSDKRKITETDPDSLRRTFERFRNRNRDLIDRFR
jgi:hypothetical protein